MKSDHRSKFSNLSNWKEEAWKKKIRASTGFEPVTSPIPVLPMCGFIAQLVEHRTGIAEVTGSNPVEALIFFRLLLSNSRRSIYHFTITTEIHARSLANFYCPYADVHINLKFMWRVSEREQAIWQFVIVKNKLMSVFNASVLLLTMNFVITLSK